MKGVATALLLVLLIAVGAYFTGWRVKGMAEAAKGAEMVRKSDQVRQRRDGQALAVGMRTETAQDAADAFFQQLRIRYDEYQRNQPGTGCVLDPVSLRI